MDYLNSQTDFDVSATITDKTPLWWIEAARAAWGVALLVAPRRVLQGAPRRPGRPKKGVTVARLLGARHLGQAAPSGDRAQPEGDRDGRLGRMRPRRHGAGLGGVRPVPLPG